MAALRKELFGVGFLKIAAADFRAGNLRGDSEDGHTTAVTVVEAVDQVQITGATTAGADCQASAEMRVRARSKRRRLFMSHVNPLDIVPFAEGIRDAIERVARDAVDSLDASSSQSLH